MKLNWLKHWKQNGLVALVIVLFSELGLHFVISDFRISLAVVLFPFFLLTISRETPAWEVGVATGAAVWVFRALYSTARGTVLANAALANLPGGLYYVFYGLLFGLIVRQRYVYHYNKLWYQIALCDFLAAYGGLRGPHQPVLCLGEGDDRFHLPGAGRDQRRGAQSGAAGGVRPLPRPFDPLRA